MTRRNWSKIVLGRFSRRAVLLLPSEPATYPHASRDATVEIFKAVLAPNTAPVRLALEYDRLSYSSAHADLLERFGFAPDPLEVFSDLLISNFLDSESSTPANGALTVATDKLLEELISSYQVASQSELSDYVESKVYESWRFALDYATFGVSDAVLLETTVNNLDRVSAIDNNQLWTPHSHAADGFALAPTQLLLQERRDAERETTEKGNARHRTCATDKSSHVPAMTTKLDDHYDVALSFASENREYVDRVAFAVKEAGLVVFYDEFERVNLWGRNLLEYFSEVYYKHSDYMVMFISEHYASKVWTKHERQSGQARAFEESREYILPARFDDTVIPGLLPTTRYEDLRDISPEAFAALIVAKHRRFRSSKGGAAAPSATRSSTIAELAATTIAQAKNKDRVDALLNSSAGVELAEKELVTLFSILHTEVRDIVKSSGAAMEIAQDGSDVCVVSSDKASASFAWVSESRDSLMHAKLVVREWGGRFVAGARGRGPKQLDESLFSFDVGDHQNAAWRESSKGGHAFTSPEFADFFLRRLVARALGSH